MKKYIVMLLACLAQGTLMTAAQASDTHGTTAEAEAMVHQAVALVKSAGADKAYKSFTEHPNGAFKNKDLYVFAYDFEGNCLAQGANPKMVGKNLYIMKDVDGKSFIKDMIDMVKSKGKGWYGPYKFNNAATSGYDVKKSYCEQGAGNTMVCVGIYEGN